MSIKTNTAMAALLKTTDIPSDVQDRLQPSQPKPTAVAEENAAAPEPPAEPVRKEVREKKKPASKPRPTSSTPSTRDRDSRESRESDDVNVGMTDLYKGESTKQFTLRMPVTMWARLKLMTTRAQLTGQGTKTQQEMILRAVENFLDEQGEDRDQQELAA